MPQACASASSSALWRPHARPPPAQQQQAGGPTREEPLDPYASALARSRILRTLGRRAPARLQLPRSLVRERGFLPGLIGPTPPSDVYRLYGEAGKAGDAARAAAPSEPAGPSGRRERCEREPGGGDGGRAVSALPERAAAGA